MRPSLLRALLCMVSAAWLVPACTSEPIDAGTTGGTADAGHPDANAGADARASRDAARAPDTPLDPADFEARCAAAGVIFCEGFDDETAFESPARLLPPGGTGEPWEARCEGGVCGRIDTSMKASGAGSLRFEIPSESGGDSAGSWDRNFNGADLDHENQIGEGGEFYVQWRQRFDRFLIEHRFQTTAGTGGFKQIILSEADRRSHDASSCTQLEVVLANIDQHGFPQAYHSCGGHDQHYEGFHYYSVDDGPLLQSVRGTGTCLWSDGDPDPAGCFVYHADEWMTFQVHVRIGTWYENRGTGGPRYPGNCDEAEHPCDSTMRMWIAREGQPSELVQDWTDGWDFANTDFRCFAADGTLVEEPDEIDCSGPDGPDPSLCGAGQSCDQAARYGAVWLTPFQTGKDEAEVHPSTFTWYDELIVSRQRIPDPAD